MIDTPLSSSWYHLLIYLLNHFSFLKPEIIGTDGQRMSATKTDFHLDLQDGTKKVRQKIAKSFCEPGNLMGNVALELCKNFVFPFYKQQMQDIGVDCDKIKGFIIPVS